MGWMGWMVMFIYLWLGECCRRGSRNNACDRSGRARASPAHPTGASNRTWRTASSRITCRNFNQSAILKNELC